VREERASWFQAQPITRGCPEPTRPVHGFQATRFQCNGFQWQGSSFMSFTSTQTRAAIAAGGSVLKPLHLCRQPFAAACRISTADPRCSRPAGSPPEWKAPSPRTPGRPYGSRTAHGSKAERSRNTR